MTEIVQSFFHIPGYIALIGGEGPLQRGSIVYSRPKASIRARPKAGARTTHCYTKWNLEGARRGGPTNRSYVINKYRTQTATTDLNVVTSEASAANSLHSGDATNAEPQPKAEARDIHTYT